MAELRARAGDAVTLGEQLLARGGRWHGAELPRLTIGELSDRFLHEYVDVYLKRGPLRGVVNGIRWRLHHEETRHNIQPIYGRSTT